MVSVGIGDSLPGEIVSQPDHSCFSRRSSFVMSIARRFSFFLPEGQGYPERPLLNHTTLGRSRSYQGMSEHHEATTGAIGNNALCAAMAYGHNEFSGAEVLVKS
jgi:hypothetical protein